MVEQQLIDYITKAKAAGQPDDQTKNLLYKNDWTEAEVAEAFAAMAQPKPQMQPQTQPQPLPVNLPVEEKVVEKPIVQVRPASETQIQAEKFQAQPVQAIAQQKMPQEKMPVMRPRAHSLLKFFIVLIILIVLGGAGYFVAGQYVNLPWNPFGPTPQTVINAMLKNMQSVKSYHSVAQINLNTIDNVTKKSQGNLTLNITGETDSTDVKNIKANGSLAFNIKSAGSSSPIFSIDTSMASIGTTSYIKVNNIVVSNNSSLTGADIDKITGKWFQIDQNSYTAISQAEGGQTSTINIVPTTGVDFANKIRALMAAENIFSNVKKLKQEVVSGQNTYHYSALITKDKLNGLIAKIMALTAQETANLPIQSNSIATVQALVQSFTNALGDVNIEMWIGKKDNMLYQFKVDKVINIADKTLGVDMNVDSKVSVVNSNFGKSITVQTPQGAQKIEDVALPILKVQKIKQDLITATYSAETIFGTNNSYYLTCKNGFLNGSKTTTYGLQYISIANDVIKQGGKNPTCFAGAKTYCISTQLADGTYLCVGTAGASGTTRCLFSGTICK